MGIVAYCPNDHRVKVKSDLAGKKGICPTCGARFRIPLESQPDRTARPAWSAPEAVPAATPAPAAAPLPALLAPMPEVTGLPVAVIISFDAAVAATLPRAVPIAASG
jgi:hypothetical protein